MRGCSDAPHHIHDPRERELPPFSWPHLTTNTEREMLNWVALIGELLSNTCSGSASVLAEPRIHLAANRARGSSRYLAGQERGALWPLFRTLRLRLAMVPRVAVPVAVPWTQVGGIPGSYIWSGAL